MTIIKRCGKTEQLSKKKIIDSIQKANESVEQDDKLTQKQIKRISDTVESFCQDLEEPIEIDILEDVIEKKIMEAQAYEVAKRYITYRYEKARVRTTKSLTEKLTASNVQNQNANVDEFSFGGRMGETASFVTKNYALEHLISKKAVHNHNNNEIYIHDLSQYAIGCHNCLSIPFDKLLKEGFSTRQTDVRPAKSISTALQLMAVIFQIQSLQQFGGVSATHADWTFVVPIRKTFFKNYRTALQWIEKYSAEDVDVFCNDIISDPVHNQNELILSNIWEDTVPSIEHNKYKLHPKCYEYAYTKTLEELNQGVEGLLHNLNTLQSRAGNQLPFTSINYGTCTLEEGRMFTTIILNNTIEGVGKHKRTAIFPCQIFQCMKSVNREPGDPNYDLFRLALKSTAQRIYPNYANCDFSGQLEWVKYDREVKQKIIDELSKEDYNKLIERLEMNPELKGILMLDVVEE